MPSNSMPMSILLLFTTPASSPRKKPLCKECGHYDKYKDANQNGRHDFLLLHDWIYKGIV